MNLKKHSQFLLYLFGSLLLRFWNFQNSLYFIYDQGRDAWVFDKIAHGHPVLVGPTSGLSGFCLGPLWYYIGLPGYILSRGNPYGICLWYIAISCLALPLYWILAHKLFKEKIWAILTAIFLSVLPGSLVASSMIWNPLLSVPLMLGALICLWQAHVATSRNRTWLAAGFLCLALTLQSEFAYGIFFIIPLFLAIPWLRKKFNVRDFIVVIAVIGVTLLPQMGFELRNHFIMTQSLLKSTASSETSVSWKLQLAQRPTQLLEATNHVLVGDNNRTPYLLPLLIILAIIGGYVILKDRTLKNSFLWQLVLIFAVLPYPFYLLWRGNNGYFFWYYLTCHFVFLVPLIFLGCWKVMELAAKKNWHKIIAAAFVLFIVLNFTAQAWQNWYDTAVHATGNANLHKMIEAVETVNTWHKDDGSQPFVVRIYTANILTEQYDYLFYWYARSRGLSIPSTVRNAENHTWYVFIEVSSRSEKSLFDQWYAEATLGGHLIKQEKIGDFQLEKWQKE
ncbi:hypothetical protein BH10PAT2_BH10PAT2_1400 [soil metagenome]